jgi:hypothetical protein
MFKRGISLGLLMALGSSLHGQTYTIRETSGRSGNNAPVTLSFLGAQGDYFGNNIHPIVNGTPRPAQVDVKSTWLDGSISHALISFPLDVVANREYSVTFGRTPLPLPNHDFCPSAELIEELQWQVDFVESNGRQTNYTFDAETAFYLLRGVKWDSEDTRIGAWGPGLRESGWVFRPTDGVNEHPSIEIHVRWRFYPGIPSALMEIIVENCRTDSVIDDLVYDQCTIRVGRNHRVLASLTDKRHLFQTRFAVQTWAGEEPPTLRIRPDIPYLANIGLLPPIDDLHEVADSQAVNFINHIMQDGERGTFDANEPLGLPLNNGPVFRYMPGAGDRHDIGWIPKWTIHAINGFGDTAEAFAQAGDMNGSGVFPIHNRDVNTGEMGLRYHNPFWSNQIRFQPDYSNPNTPSVSHIPLLGYVSYLLTGRKLFLEEMVSWTCYVMRDWYPNNGTPKLMGDRRAAWTVRNMALTAAILPDDHPLRGYFRDRLDRTADHYATKLDTALPMGTYTIGGWKASGRTDWPVGLRVSPWQNAWFTAMSLITYKLHGHQIFLDMATHNWNFFRLGYLQQDSWTAPNGDFIQSNPSLLMQYSKCVGVYTPETRIVNGTPTWGVRSGSHMSLTNWSQMQWFERICYDLPVRHAYDPPFPQAGPEPIYWRPNSGSYSPPPGTHYDEYGVGRVALHWLALLQGLPEAWEVSQIVEPWVQAQWDQKAAPHPAGIRFSGHTYFR